MNLSAAQQSTAFFFDRDHFLLCFVVTRVQWKLRAEIFLFRIWLWAVYCLDQLQGPDGWTSVRFVVLTLCGLGSYVKAAQQLPWEPLPATILHTVAIKIWQHKSNCIRKRSYSTVPLWPIKSNRRTPVACIQKQPTYFNGMILCRGKEAFWYFVPVASYGTMGGGGGSQSSIPIDLVVYDSRNDLILYNFPFDFAAKLLQLWCNY